MNSILSQISGDSPTGWGELDTEAFAQLAATPAARAAQRVAFYKLELPGGAHVPLSRQQQLTAAIVRALQGALDATQSGLRYNDNVVLFEDPTPKAGPRIASAMFYIVAPDDVQQMLPQDALEGALQAALGRVPCRLVAIEKTEFTPIPGVEPDRALWAEPNNTEW